MKENAVVFEKTANGWSAYAPDLPGLGVAAATIEETEKLLRADPLAVGVSAMGWPHGLRGGAPMAAAMTGLSLVKRAMGCGLTG
jgi:hypothetical protein